MRIDGSQPWEPRIHHPRFYARVLVGGSLGAGESYVDGDWDCDALDEFAARVLSAGIDEQVGLGLSRMKQSLLALVANRQDVSHAATNGRAHYDRSNELYEAMLGPSMVYSCGYWRAADHLEAAQTAKLDLICQKLQLRPGQRVLDIGCGWGTFAKHAAERFGVEVVGITVSPAQAEYARTACAGLAVEIRLQDYREVRDSFDRVVSIGMFEHVGPRNYRAYMECAQDCLRPRGLFLLHTIGSLRSNQSIEPWMDKYIFPGATLPSAAQITAAAEGLFVLEDWHNFGADYDRTLMAWYVNFENAWPRLRQRFDDRFFRLWRYYLLTCAGSFRARCNQLWQIVLARGGVPGGYHRHGH